MKQKTHSFIITVRTDRKCTRRVALREVRNCVHGQFYASPRADGEPESFRITSITDMPRRRMP